VSDGRNAAQHEQGCGTNELTRGTGLVDTNRSSITFSEPIHLASVEICSVVEVFVVSALAAA